jgi:branched-chain amino acid transport system ATP-binding protein
MPLSSSCLLELEGLNAGYGETVVLENINLRVTERESVSVIGRNGMGKTTLLGTMMGYTDVHSGRLLFSGRDITHGKIYERVRAGLSLVPQEREVFSSLTVGENLAVSTRPGGWTREGIFDLFPQLAARESYLGNQLSGGEQQMLSIARALMGRPTMLLMDEPTEGLAPVIIDELVRAMHALRSRVGLSIVLVEQHTEIALEFAERTIVMNRGKIAYDGASATLHGDRSLLNSLAGVAGE